MRLGRLETRPGKGRPGDVPQGHSGPAIEAGGWRLSIPAASGPWPEPGRNAASPRGLPVSSPAQSRTPGGFPDQRVGWGLRASSINLNTPPAFLKGNALFRGMFWSGIRTHYTQITGLLLYPMSYPKVTESNRHCLRVGKCPPWARLCHGTRHRQSRPRPRGLTSPNEMTNPGGPIGGETMDVELTLRRLDRPC